MTQGYSVRPPAPAHTRRPEYPSGLRADIGRLAGMPAQEPLGDRIPSGWCLRNSAGRGDIATSGDCEDHFGLTAGARRSCAGQAEGDMDLQLCALSLTAH